MKHEICNVCKTSLEGQLILTFGNEYQKAIDNAARIMSIEASNKCQKLCIPTLEASLWFDAVKRRQHG